MNRTLFVIFSIIIFTLASAFTSIKKTDTSSTNPAIFKLMEITYLWDLLKEGYEPDRDRDDTWLEVGFRSKYAMTKNYAALEIIETAFGQKVFSSGPHGRDMDFNSVNSFGHYNPNFISELQIALYAAMENPVFKQAMETLYHQHLKDMAQVHFDAYIYLTQNPDYQQLMQDKYVEEMNGSAGMNINSFTENFRDFANFEEQKGLDVYEGFNAPTFWLRRMIDGTAPQMLYLQTLVMKALDPDFVEAPESAEEVAAYEKIIQEQLALLAPIAKAPENQIPTEESAGDGHSSGAITDNRDQQYYEWVRLKDGKKWLAKNLNVSFYAGMEKDCSNCETYGRFYTWDMAQQACPETWRLPSAEEWDNLIELYGGRYKAYDALIQGGDTNFNALLGGSMDSYGQVSSLESEGNYWSSSATNDSDAWHYTFFGYDGTKINKYEGGKKYALSCRCIQD